jgi:putative membrane protein
MAGQPFSARSGMERISGWAAVGLVLLPAVIGGLLTWGLSAPTAQLERVTAAIVNDDVAVTVDGTSVPLGRQFAAGLIAGGGDSVSGGTSTSGSATAESAPAASVDNFTWVLTNDTEARSGLVAGRYATVVTIPSTFSAMATSISGPAADATQAHLKVETSPASAFIDPALAKAVTAAATASLNRQLISQYLGNVYGGFNTINQQIAQAASGAASLSSGASSVSSGAQSLAGGASSLASGLSSLDAGAASLASGLGTLDAASQGLPAQTDQLAQGAGQVAAATDSASSALSGATDSFATVVAQVCQRSGPVCDRATAALARLRAADADVAQLSAGADQVAAGNQALAAAMPQLVAGIGQSAAGASQVASGAAQADAGGASLSSGAAELAQGAAQLDSGEAQLAQSLAGAVKKIPTYSESDIAVLSAVVSQPVIADQRPPATGSQSVPLFCVVSLWIGGLVIALARKPVPSRQLMTSVPSWSIAARTLAIGAVLGAAQGLVTAACLLLGLSVGPEQWFSFVGLAMFAGATFAIVNQGLAAAFGAVGRMVGVVVAVVALGVGLASTVPPVFSAIAALLPTSPALAMLRAAAVGDAAGAWLGAGGCLIFAVIGALLVFAGVALRRGVRASELSPLRVGTRAGAG